MTTAHQHAEERTNVWIRAIVYGAGLQGACTKEVADLIIEEALILHRTTENAIEYCTGQAMSIANEREEATFSNALITWLMT